MKSAVFGARARACVCVYFTARFVCVAADARSALLHHLLLLLLLLLSLFIDSFGGRYSVGWGTRALAGVDDDVTDDDISFGRGSSSSSSFEFRLPFSFLSFLFWLPLCCQLRRIGCRCKPEPDDDDVDDDDGLVVAAAAAAAAASSFFFLQSSTPLRRRRRRRLRYILNRVLGLGFPSHPGLPFYWSLFSSAVRAQ